MSGKICKKLETRDGSVKRETLHFSHDALVCFLQVSRACNAFSLLIATCVLTLSKKIPLLGIVSKKVVVLKHNVIWGAWNLNYKTRKWFPTEFRVLT